MILSNTNAERGDTVQYWTSRGDTAHCITEPGRSDTDTDPIEVILSVTDLLKMTTSSKAAFWEVNNNDNFWFPSQLGSFFTPCPWWDRVAGWKPKGWIQLPQRWALNDVHIEWLWSQTLSLTTPFSWAPLYPSVYLTGKSLQTLSSQYQNRDLLLNFPSCPSAVKVPLTGSSWLLSFLWDPGSEAIKSRLDSGTLSCLLSYSQCLVDMKSN